MSVSPAPAAAAAKSSVVASSWQAVSIAVVGLAAGGLFIAGALRSPAAPDSGRTLAAPPAVPGPAAAPSELEAKPAAERGDVPADPLVPGTAVSSDDLRIPTRQKSSDRLAEEVAILSRAQTELHAERFAESLRMLDEHARKFPRGALAQERRATRIQALCGMDRMAEAEAELAKLAPGSVHEGRARQACAGKRRVTAR
ncbi:MAG TPA: hypothetical protein VGK73_06455 [Polyangiaceae bacterium]